MNLSTLEKIEAEVEWEAKTAADNTPKLFSGWRAMELNGCPNHWSTATPLMVAKVWNDLQPSDWLDSLETSWRAFTSTKKASELVPITWKVRPPVPRSERVTVIQASKPPEEEAKFPEVYRMPRCKKCPKYCKPCLTVLEAQIVQEGRTEAKDAGSNETWKMDNICDACYKKSNAKQNEYTAEKAGHGKPKGRLGQIQQLLDALDACEKAGYVMTEQELAQLNKKMKQLGIG